MAAAMPEQQQQLLPAQQQLDVLPRWLRWSGLPQVLGPTAWALYQALVITDHQTMGLPSRRHWDGRGFEATHDELVAVTGYDRRTVRRHLARLVERGPLSRYQEGRGGRASWFEINGDLLRQLYRYVGPILRPEHQGLRGCDLHASAEGGYVIYGFMGRYAIIAEWHDLWMAQRAAEGRLPERPVLAQVRMIVENSVDNKEDRESTSEVASGQRVPSEWTESPLPSVEVDSVSSSQVDSVSTTMENRVVEHVRLEQP